MKGIVLTREESKKIAESLKEITQYAEKEAKVVVKAVNLANATKSSLRNVIGTKNESMKAEKMEKAAIIFLTFPGDPTGITYAVGATLYGTSKAVKAVERKEMGIRDLIRYYRRLGLELGEILR